MNARLKTVVVADDHPLTLRGITEAIEGSTNFRVTDQAINGAEALASCLRNNPDILIVDIEMPVMSGIEVCKNLASHDSRSKVLAISAYDKVDYVYGVIDAGASGYLLKQEATANMLIEALDFIILHDDTWLSPNMSRSFVSKMIEGRFSKKDSVSLSPRELEVLRYVKQGDNNDDISNKLFISSFTVKNHIDNIRNKIGLRSRSELIVWAWENDM